MERNNEEDRTGLVTFSCKEAYVYKAPSASTIGHRAELWDVDSPMQEVACSVVTSGDNCWARLTDNKSGDLFAECPIVKDKPLTASVEPVIDSSRYFMLRVVDRESGRHAFLGFGFRERSHATDFMAALSDHIGYLRRLQEAREMQEAFWAAQNGQQGPNLPTLDFSLKPGETVSLKLADKAPVPRSSFFSKRLAAVTIAEPGQSGALLPPPPPAVKLEPRSLCGPLQEGPLAAADPALEASHADGSSAPSEHGQQQRQDQEPSEKVHGDGSARKPNQQQQQISLPASGPQTPSHAVEEEEDQFGSFVVA